MAYSVVVGDGRSCNILVRSAPVQHRRLDTVLQPACVAGFPKAFIGYALFGDRLPNLAPLVSQELRVRQAAVLRGDPGEVALFKDADV